MFCDEALDVIEPIASGELTADGRVAAHLESCPNCAAVLEAARRLDGMLRARAIPQPPAQFTARTMALVRRQRWRSEQFLDLGFNLALTVGVLIIAGVVWVLVARSGLAAASTDTFTLLSSGFVTLARWIAPSLPLYAGATALLVAALGLWWWAEREMAP